MKQTIENPPLWLALVIASAAIWLYLHPLGIVLLLICAFWLGVGALILSLCVGGWRVLWYGGKNLKEKSNGKKA